ASGVIQQEINNLYRTWNGILSSGMQERSMAYFYAAVTDLDRNGRLELLITWHFLNRDPLYFAGDDIGEEKKKQLTDLCDNFPSRIHSRAYEISKDRIKLEPLLELQYREGHAPDFTRLHIRGKMTDGHCIYYAERQLMPRVEGMTSAAQHYAVEHEAQIIWLDAGLMGVGTTALTKGTVDIGGAEIAPHYTSMKIIPTHQDLNPYGSEAEAFERERQERGGRYVNFVDWQALNKDARTALASSWYGWSYESEE
ncbi:MAG: hypothetical protein ACFNLO_12800, partial [Selenomonas massiliensis]